MTAQQAPSPHIYAELTCSQRARGIPGGVLAAVTARVGPRAAAVDPVAATDERWPGRAPTAPHRVRHVPRGFAAALVGTSHERPAEPPAAVTAQDEVTDLLVDLIRINTSNPTHPERPAAEWVAEKLDEVGIESQIIEAEPGPGLDDRPHRGQRLRRGRRC